MIYQDQFETIAAIRTHLKFRMISIISVISFEVNIVAKHANAKRMTIMAMGVLLHWTQANSFELVVRQSNGRP